MLTDPKEIEIISNAKQKNVRDPHRSRAHFEHIIEDFFAGVVLDGHYIDMGPGQFDFGELAKLQGGLCDGIDFDPAVCELGRHKGFDVYELNLKQFAKTDLKKKYDGVWNKFALNAFWHFEHEDRHEALIDAIAEILKPDGWSWISPWNGVPKKREFSEDEISHTLSLQEKFFAKHGFVKHNLTKAQSKHYGVHGAVANDCVFVKGLTWKP